MKVDIEQFDERDGGLRRQDYDGETLFIVDLGTGIGDATVDTTDGTAIVVTDTGEQFEFDLPDGVRGTSIRNGVLTIEVDR